MKRLGCYAGTPRDGIVCEDHIGSAEDLTTHLFPHFFVDFSVRKEQHYSKGRTK